MRGNLLSAHGVLALKRAVFLRWCLRLRLLVSPSFCASLLSPSPPTALSVCLAAGLISLFDGSPQHKPIPLPLSLTLTPFFVSGRVFLFLFAARDVAKSLKPAMENALKIKKNLQRTNEMTLADVISVSQIERTPRLIWYSGDNVRST